MALPSLPSVVLACALAALPLAAGAVGGHDKLGCVGCHSMHAGKGARLAALSPNRKMLDPRTNAPHQPVTAGCLACHAEPAEGGKGYASIANHFGHPFSRESVNPRKARVPEELLRDGRFECISCHDPHPSNPNYRYLRVPGDKSPGFTVFCGICHPRKADADAAPPVLFDSMDEQAARPRR